MYAGRPTWQLVFKSKCVVTLHRKRQPRYLANEHKMFNIKAANTDYWPLCLRNISDIVKFVIRHLEFYQTAFWPVVTVSCHYCGLSEYYIYILLHLQLL